MPAHRSHHSTGISGTVGAPDTPQKSGNLCAVVGFAVMFPVGARRPTGHSTGGGTPTSRTCPTYTSRFAGRWALPWIALASECPASAIPGGGVRQTEDDCCPGTFCSTGTTIADTKVVRQLPKILPELPTLPVPEPLGTCTVEPSTTYPKGPSVTGVSVTRIGSRYTLPSSPRSSK